MPSKRSTDAMPALADGCGWISPANDALDRESVLGLGCGTGIDPVGELLVAADESVDAVVANCIFSMSPDRPRILAEIARVLRPGGRVRASDIVAEDIPEWVRKGAALRGSCIRWAGSEAEYLAGLRHAGLSHATVGGRYVYDRDQLARLESDEANRSLEDDVVDALVGRVWSALFTATKPHEPRRS